MDKKVNFYSGPGLRLAGIVSLPPDYKEGSGKRPGIVLCHGPGGYKDPDIVAKDPLMPVVSNWLTTVGYVVLRFSYRGVGGSEGPEYRMLPMEQVEDIRNAITFLERQKEVDTSHIGLLGLATGAGNVSYVAGIDFRVKCMVGVSGAGDCGRWMQAIRRYWEWRELLKMVDEDRVNRVVTGKSRYIEMKEVIIHDPESEQSQAEMEKMHPELKTRKRLLSLDSAEAFLNFRPETVVDKISPRAAMWICAGNDTLVPVEESQSMYEKAGEPKRLIILEGEGHHGLYKGAAFERVMTHATEWFDTYLRKR